MLYEILIFLIIVVCLICYIYKKRRHNLKPIIDAPEEIIITNNTAKVPAVVIEKPNPMTLQITEVESQHDEKQELISDDNKNNENNENTAESELKNKSQNESQNKSQNKSSKSQYDETTLSILTEELQNIYHNAAIDLLMDNDF